MVQPLVFVTCYLYASLLSNTQVAALTANMPFLHGTVEIEILLCPFCIIDHLVELYGWQLKGQAFYFEAC